MTHPSARPSGPDASAASAATAATTATAAPAALVPAKLVPPGPPPPVVADPRQRWRLTYARDVVPGDAVGRAAIDAWQAALADSGLPIAGLESGGAGRARIAFAAPLSARARGAAELADLWLLERLPLWAVREALTDRMPPAHRWIAAEDAWLGAPALAGRVIAADWAIDVVGAATAGRDRLRDAARGLLAAAELPRVRLKGTTEKHYDLRPLLADVSIAVGAVDGDDASAVVRVRTRFDPEAGSGRPEEVVAALAEASGLPLAINAMTRERLLLADDFPKPPTPPVPSSGCRRR